MLYPFLRKNLHLLWERLLNVLCTFNLGPVSTVSGSYLWRMLRKFNRWKLKKKCISCVFIYRSTEQNKNTMKWKENWYFERLTKISLTWIINPLSKIIRVSGAAIYASVSSCDRMQLASFKRCKERKTIMKECPTNKPQQVTQT